MRVYLPATLPMLARWQAGGEVGPGPLGGHGVTPALREWYAAGDLEELEYAAMADAARAALSLLAADRDAPARRVVVAAEVPEAACSVVTAPEEPVRSGVRVAQSLPWAVVAAVHVDDVAALPVIAAAVDALAAAEAGDADAMFAVDEAEGWELQWWATQEVVHLLEGTG